MLAHAADIIRNIAEEMMPLFNERKISLEMDVSDTMPMLGDSSLIFSLFHNIFGNTLAHAVNATRFLITAKAGTDRYTFTFSDNGVGVHPESAHTTPGGGLTITIDLKPTLWLHRVFPFHRLYLFTFYLF